MLNFFMLIGLPGSGKTKLAKQLADKNTIILSSDSMRKEFYGNESVQDSPTKIFEEMQRRAIHALKNGNSVIYDATNISRKKRKHILSSIHSPCVKKAYVVWAKYETCLERDSRRIRNVGESVIRRTLLNFQPPYYDEGWDDIEFVIGDSPYSRKDYNYWVDCEHDNHHHNNSVKEHTLEVMSEVVKKGQNHVHSKSVTHAILIAASLHDIGKKFVKSFKDSKENVGNIAHFYNHQNVGSYFAIGYEETLGLSIEERALIYWLINVHMDPFLHTKYSSTLPDALFNILNTFHQCDVGRTSLTMTMFTET